MCFLLTISTAFEHKLIEEPKYINIYTQEPCNEKSNATVIGKNQSAMMLLNDNDNIKNVVNNSIYLLNNKEKIFADISKRDITDVNNYNEIKDNSNENLTTINSIENINDSVCNMVI